MKKLGIIALSAVVFGGVAQAQTFSNDTWSTDLPNTGAQISNKDTCHNLDLRNFILNGNRKSAGLAWNFDFTSGAAPFGSVDFTIFGTVTSSSPGFLTRLNIFGSEQVFDTSSAAALVGSGVNVGQVDVTANGNNWPLTVPFAVSVSIPFSSLVSKGSVSKDIFFSLSGGFNGGTGGPIIGNAEITRIQQCFNPVPEPASMAGLAAGLAFLVRRRKK